MSNHSQLSLRKTKTLVPFGDLCPLLPSSETPHFIIYSGHRSKKRHLAFQWHGFPFVVSKIFKLVDNGYEKGCTPFCLLASWPIVWIQKQWTAQGILSVYPDKVLSLSWRDPVFCSSLHCCINPAAFRSWARDKNNRCLITFPPFTTKWVPWYGTASFGMHGRV